MCAHVCCGYDHQQNAVWRMQRLRVGAIEMVCECIQHHALQPEEHGEECEVMLGRRSKRVCWRPSTKHSEPDHEHSAPL